MYYLKNYQLSGQWLLKCFTVRGHKKIKNNLRKSVQSIQYNLIEHSSFNPLFSFEGNVT